MKTRALALLALAALAACQGESPTGSNTPPSFDISDGTHAAGNVDFFFLPPMVPDPSGSPNWDALGFNPDLLPRVEICALDLPASAPEGDVTPLTPCRVPPATNGYLAISGTPALPAVTLNAAGPYYETNWVVPLDPNNVYYRIGVYVASTRLGFADVHSVFAAKSLRNVNTGEFIGRVDGSTLPIKFRIEQYALCATPGVGPCGSSSVRLNAGGNTKFKGLGSDFVIGEVTIPVQDDPSTADPVLVTVEGCADFRDRATDPLDLPTFGPCVRVTADPAIELSNAATVFICTIAPASGGQNVGVVSEDQEHRITVHRRDELPTPSVVALPHVPGCPVVLSAVDRSLKGFLTALVHGRLKDAGARLLGIVAPQPLYARRFIDVGGGGLTPDFSDFQLALPARLEKTGGDNQAGALGAALPIPAEVTAFDVGGEPVGGVRARFLATADGAPNPEIVVSTAATTGKASTIWTMRSEGTEDSLKVRGFGVGGADFNGPRAGVDPFQPIQPPFDAVPALPYPPPTALTTGTTTFFAFAADGPIITSLSLTPATAPIYDGELPPPGTLVEMGWTATLANPTAGPIGPSPDPVILQTWFYQGANFRAAGGFTIICSATFGELPPGTCIQSSSTFARNAPPIAGSGTLVPGAALFRVELKLGGVVVHTVDRPVTLVAFP